MKYAKAILKIILIDWFGVIHMPHSFIFFAAEVVCVCNVASLIEIKMHNKH